MIHFIGCQFGSRYLLDLQGVDIIRLSKGGFGVMNVFLTRVADFFPHV